MDQYLDLLRRVRTTGVKKTDRTGTGTLSVFGHQMRFDLASGFPLVTTKKLHVKSIIHELIWFLAGDTTLDYLHANKLRIWDEWARELPRSSQIVDDPEINYQEEFDALAMRSPTCLDLGPVYGKQWRSWATPDGGSIDQMQAVVEQIQKNPDSRRGSNLLLITQGKIYCSPCPPGAPAGGAPGGLPRPQPGVVQAVTSWM